MAALEGDALHIEDGPRAAQAAGQQQANEAGLGSGYV
jgi:hypothetical protein